MKVNCLEKLLVLKMDSDEKTLLSDIDLVRFDRPELVANKPTPNTTNQVMIHKYFLFV